VLVNYLPAHTTEYPRKYKSTPKPLSEHKLHIELGESNP